MQQAENSTPLNVRPRTGEAWVPRNRGTKTECGVRHRGQAAGRVAGPRAAEGGGAQRAAPSLLLAPPPLPSFLFPLRGPLLPARLNSRALPAEPGRFRGRRQVSAVPGPGRAVPAARSPADGRGAGGKRACGRRARAGPRGRRPGGGLPLRRPVRSRRGGWASLHPSQAAGPGPGAHARLEPVGEVDGAVLGSRSVQGPGTA